MIYPIFLRIIFIELVELEEQVKKDKLIHFFQNRTFNFKVYWLNIYNLMINKMN